MARKIRQSTTWFATIAVASMLLSGCAATSAGAPAPEPAPSHTMPDGTVMSGAEHEGHEADGDEAEDGVDETSDQAPSAAAEMICTGQVVTSAIPILGIADDAEPTSNWDAPMYTCTFDVDGAPLVLTVHDTTDPAAGQQHFDELQESLGAEQIEGLLGLGLPSFSTGDGIVAFLRDGKTLVVDATALPDSIGDAARTQDEAAYAMASAVLVCWVHHA